MLKLQDLTKAYRTDEVETVALNNVNIEIDHGEFVAIMGPSGCGKSTLLNLISGYYKPTGGQIRLGGIPTSQIAMHRCVAYHEQVSTMNTCLASIRVIRPLFPF